jgi:hypothetical protein
MADLTFIEKKRLETFLGMGSGYVMDFSDRTFQAFVGEITGINIYDPKYMRASGSKAHRLRAFWDIENNQVVATLVKGFLDYWLSKVQDGLLDYHSDEALYKNCLEIVARLTEAVNVPDLEVLKPNSSEKDFDVLAKSIKAAIENNEPETALDRLHTFLFKYNRQLCETHQLSYTKEDPLHSLFGKYIKFLKSKGIPESIMGERILRSSISVIDAFNDVRNNNSFAHDNPLLSYQESVLIFNNIVNLIKYIEEIEKGLKEELNIKNPESLDELPF